MNPLFQTLREMAARVADRAYEDGWKDATQYHGRKANEAPVPELRKMAEYRQLNTERIIKEEMLDV